MPGVVCTRAQIADRQKAPNDSSVNADLKYAYSVQAALAYATGLCNWSAWLG